MDDYTKQKLDELAYTIFKSGFEDFILVEMFKELNIKPFDENCEYVTERLSELKGERPKVNWIDAKVVDEDKIVEKVIKKLTLRLDKDNVDLLNKLEKRFPSLSQNQVLNHVIQYGSERILKTVGEEVNNNVSLPFVGSGRILNNSVEFCDSSIYINDKIQYGVSSFAITSQMDKANVNCYHYIEIMVDVSELQYLTYNTLSSIKVTFEKLNLEYVMKDIKFVERVLVASEQDHDCLKWKYTFSATSLKSDKINK